MESQEGHSSLALCHRTQHLPQPGSLRERPLLVRDVLGDDDRTRSRWSRVTRSAAAALGAIHDRGEGVPRNLATAAIWYSEAADHGDEIAAERLEELRAETRDIFKGMRFV